MGKWPAFRINVSQVPTSVAIWHIALSSMTLAGKVRQTVFGLTVWIDSLVWRSVDSVRPIRTRRLAPAMANVMAVSRPIPLPLLHYGLSVLLGSSA